MISSPSGLHFKGSGWYVTDYAKKNGKSADSPSNPKGEAKPSSSSDKEVSSKETKPKPSSSD